jgi:hypothetical protein
MYLASLNTPSSLEESEWYQSGIKIPLTLIHRARNPPRSPCKSSQKREPTSGLEPLTCSLRVIIHALQGVAHSCESRISKPLSLLRFARCCTVLRSRWCQSGVNIVLCIRVTQSSTLVPFGAHRASLTSCDRPVNLCPRLMHLAIRHRLGTDGPTSPP